MNQIEMDAEIAASSCGIPSSAKSMISRSDEGRSIVTVRLSPGAYPGSIWKWRSVFRSDPQEVVRDLTEDISDLYVEWFNGLDGDK